MTGLGAAWVRAKLQKRKNGRRKQHSLKTHFYFLNVLDKSMFIMTLINLVSTHHRRRMETEGKAKVVKSIWGATFFQSLPRKLFCLGLFVRNDWIQPVYLKETVEFNRFFQLDRDKTASVARYWTHFAPQTDATTIAMPSVSILLLCCGVCSYCTVLALYHVTLATTCMLIILFTIKQLR